MEDADAVALALLFTLQLLLISLKKTPEHRRPCLKRKRLNWKKHARRLEATNSFHSCYKMSRRAFEALLALIAPSLDVDEKQSRNRTGAEPISPANKLQMFLRYMSGGSVHDIITYSGVSNSAFYDSIHQVMDALLEHPELQIKFPESDEEQQRVMQGFASISNGGVMKGCVGAVDGWLCPIDVPRRDEVDKVRPFYSGHYRCYGVNVQACCDHLSRFTAIGISSPGGTGDSVAFREWGLSQIVKRLKLGRYIVGDNAYANDNTLLTPFPRPSVAGDVYRDSFNYHLSQLRIRIEMAFGLLVRKWRIFRTPLQVRFDNVARVVMAGCILHNWCINQRLAEDPNYNPQHDEVLLEAVATVRDPVVGDDSVYRQLYQTAEDASRRRALIENQRNLVRDAIVSMLRRNSAQRPQRNIRRRARTAAQN